jgi:hypothetical protein
MTSDSPAGEYLELEPQGTPPPASSTHAQIERSVTTGLTMTTQRVAGPQETARVAIHTSQTPVCDISAQATPARAKVLRPAHAENWQSSSFDLLSGLQVRDVSDTIPGRVFEELFKTIPATVFTKRRY